MKNRDTSSHTQGQGPLESEKKLRKRERRLNERLLDALAAQEKARERLQRAEARLKKREARVQRLEGRLTVLHQQLADYTTPPATSAQAESVEIDGSRPPHDAASPIDVGTDGSRPAQLNGASSQLRDEAIPIQAHPAIIRETSIVAESGFAELPADEDTEGEQVAEEVPTKLSAVVEHEEDDKEDEEKKDFVVPDEEEEDEEIEDFIVSEDEEDEDEEDEYDEYDDYDDAEEEELEFRRRVAPNRVVTRSVQTPATQQIITEEPVPDSVVPQSEQTTIEEPVPDSASPQSEQITTEEVVPNRPVAILASAEALAYAREARAAAQATEDAARLAFARAAEVAQRLELLGGGRHLMQELTQLETEAEQMQTLARENAHTAEVAEQQIDPAELGRLHAEMATLEDELEDEETEETDQTPPVLIADFEAPPPLLIADYEKVSLASPDLYPSKPSEQTPLLFAPGEIEDEEEMVEAVTSMLIADAAAAAAAKAEALAEASSARTREARRLAVQADKTLQQLRITIEQGVLPGDEAERALRAAEREATYAHAAFADAEVAEERARRDAMNAEAEAEVAEGMAMAADAHARDKEKEQVRFHNPYAVTADIDTPYDLLDNDDSDDTLEHPAIRPLHPRESA